MSSSLDTHCLMSTVRNTSGGRRLFGFLPPHGRDLANNEEMSIFGDILDAVAHSNGGDRNASRRAIQSFENEVHLGNLIVVHSPGHILEDTVTGLSKMVKVTSGTIGVSDPCWANAGSIVDDETGGEDFTGR